MSAHPVLIAEGPSDIGSRLSQIEAFNEEVSQAVDSLVNTILEIRELQQAPSVAPTPAPTPSPVNQELLDKVQELESQLSQERISRQLAEVSRAHPKSRRVVFLGRRSFVDNVKYTWLAFTEQAKQLGIDCWFLPLDPGVERLVTEMGGQCLPANQISWSGAQVSILLSAAVVVSDDHLMTLAPSVAAMLAGARHVQLWHGVGIKDVGYANLPPLSHFTSHTARLLNTCGPFSTFVSTGAALEPEWRRSFSFQRYDTSGYARNDVLYREPTERDLVNVDTDMLQRMRQTLARGARVFMYAPTFRDAQLASWIVEVELDAIAKAAKQRGDLLVLNLHPCEQPWQTQLQRALPGVAFVKEGTDLYPLLKQSSALITDYSSLLFDYLHLDRPIIQFQPDHERYVSQSRKLHDDKETTLVGYIANTPRQLMQLLRQDTLETAAHQAKRRELLERFYEVRDGQSAQRLCQLIDGEVSALAPRHALGTAG